MEVVIPMACKGQGSQAAFPGVDLQFFPEFPDQRRFRGFAILHLAAGEFPKSAEKLVLRALRQENAPIAVD